MCNLVINAINSAVFVQGRSAFSENGQIAKLGVKAFAFMWTAVACLLLANIFFGVGGGLKSDDGGYSGREQRRRGFFSSARSSSLRSNKETNV